MSRADLEEERQFLLDSLRDLEREHEAGDIAEDDYAALRDDYTARAAEVLRALEAEDRGERPGPLRPISGRPGSRKVVAAVLLLGMVALAVGSVSLLASDRRSGEPITGSLPETVQGKLQLAHQYDAEGEAVEALKLYDAVLKEDPLNVEALTYRGWLLKRAGLADPAQASLDKALTIDPSYGDARFFRGMLLYQDRKDPAAAIPEFEAYLASNPPPETVEAVQGVLSRAKAEAAASTTTVPDTTVADTTATTEAAPSG